MVNAPTNLSVTKVSNGFKLSWTINDSDTTGGVTIERSSDGGNTFFEVVSGIDKNSETFLDSTSIDTETPTYRITRVTDDTTSSSNPVEYTEPDPIDVPESESLEAITRSPSEIELRWRGDAADSEYAVYRSTSPQTDLSNYTELDIVTANTFNQYVDSNLSEGKEYYYRTAIPGIDATGGTTVTDVTIDGTDYRIHAFENVGSDTFTVNRAPSGATVDVLMVGGGGSGGTGDDSGGGGAGGLIFEPNYSVSEQNYTITVGSGGDVNDTTSRGFAVSGDDTEMSGSSTGLELRALGGGHGESYDNNPPAANGGSGGGTAANKDNAGSALQPSSQWGGFGNDGGNNRSTESSDGSGGGGAGEAGGTGGQYNGGDGLKEVTINGTTYNFANTFTNQFGEDADNDGNSWFAGGGMGGGEDASTTNHTAGKGGGADSFSKSSVPNTGGGGAAFDDNVSDTSVNDGASGIVLIRYEI